MFKLSGFGDEISPELEEQLETMEEAGVRLLELRGVWGKNVLDLTDEELARIREALDERGFSVSSIGSPIGKVKITDDFSAHLERFQRAIQVAKFMRTQYIRVFSYYIPEGEERTTWRDEVLHRMATKANIAEEHGVILLLENDVELYAEKPQECLDIVKTVNSPHLRLLFDPANFVMVDVKPYSEAFSLLREYIEYMHIKDARFSDKRVVPAGEGDGQIGEILKELKEQDIILSLEPHLQVAGKSAGFSGADLFKLAAESLKRLIESIGGEYI